jgi:hypothetical protein
MQLKKPFKNIIILSGYILSVFGGIIGLILGLFLLQFPEQGTEKHGKMIAGVSIGTALLYAFFTLYKFKLISGDIIIPLLFMYFIISALAGGYIAYKKGDFFTRGFFIALFTGIWGISILLFTSASKARENKTSDKHYWPRESWISLVLMAANIIVLMCAGKIFT